MSHRGDRFWRPSLDSHPSLKGSNIKRRPRTHSLASRGAEVQGDRIDLIGDRYLRFERSTRACLAVIQLLLLTLNLTTIDAGQIPAALIRRNGRVQNIDLVISATSLIARVEKSEKLLLIDIRDAPDFETLHIPGAMNIPLHFIKTKPHLKTVPLVLVDRGLSSQRLSIACRELRKIGFDARFLDGGMHAWSSWGGPMLGDQVRQINFSRITPADFFLEKDDAQHIVCDVSDNRSSASQQLIPYAVHIPIDGSPRHVVSMFKEFRSAHAREGAFTLLIFNESGTGYRNIAGFLERAGFKKVFYLEGGVNAYRDYMEGLFRSWRPRGNRLLTNEPFGGCGERK